jgi:hypothetical protein
VITASHKAGQFTRLAGRVGAALVELADYADGLR